MIFRPQPRRRCAAARAGHVAINLLLVVGLCLALLAGIYTLLLQLRRSMACQANLRTLYHALEMYEMERGALPKLSFFPDSPTDDADSLRVVLETYGADGTACICPAAPASLREWGLTYVWNVQLNNRKIPRGEDRVWMLVDMQALSSDVPAPHLRRYLVLYSDGSVERITQPRQRLSGL